MGTYLKSNGLEQQPRGRSCSLSRVSVQDPSVVTPHSGRNFAMEGHTDNALPNARNDTCNTVNTGRCSLKSGRNGIHTSGYENIFHLGGYSQVMVPDLPVGRGKERRN